MGKRLVRNVCIFVKALAFVWGIISLSYTKSLACGCSKEKKETINVIARVYATEFCMHDVIQTVNVA